MIQFFSKRKGEKGFTLIELLVVIAIIGILAGIVLVALGGARDRAKDARIQADIAQIRTTGELVYSTNSPNSYLDLCADDNIVTLAADILAQNPDTTLTCVISTGIAGEPAADGAYCAYAQLNSDQWACADSTLAVVQLDNEPVLANGDCEAGDDHTCAVTP